MEAGREAGPLSKDLRRLKIQYLILSLLNSKEEIQRVVVIVPIALKKMTKGEIVR